MFTVTINLRDGRSNLLENESCEFLGMLILDKEAICGLFFLSFHLHLEKTQKEITKNKLTFSLM